MIGRYSSFNTDMMRQHVLWMNRIGIDAIGIDWTNNLWNIDSFNNIGIYAKELINATTQTLEYYNYLQSVEGIPVPQFVLLLGLDNGPSTTMNALYGEVNFITTNYLDQFGELFVQLDDKPLLIIFDGGNIHSQDKPLNNTDNYTLRWMSTQFQASRLNEQGFYSWMDGTINPLPTYVNSTSSSTNNNDKRDGNMENSENMKKRKNDETETELVEALTITNAFFPSAGGWFSDEAYSTDNGATLLLEGQSAVKYLPKLLFICQWNEYAGQAQSNSSSQSYVDIYNSTLGNDMEPTSLTACGYQRPNNAYCGGWGFRYVNILQAILYTMDTQLQLQLQSNMDGDINNSSDNSMFLVISQPVPWLSYSLNGTLDGKTKGSADDSELLNVGWVTLGYCEYLSKFSVWVDGIFVNYVSKNVSQYQVNLAQMNINVGWHNLTVIGENCTTVVDLPYTKLSAIDEQNNNIPVMDSVTFQVVV